MPERRRAIRVLTVDDHAVTRQGLSLLLGHVNDIEVVGAASDGRRAVQMAVDLRPEVVIMDAVMPNLNGVDATRQVKQQLPACRVVILSGLIDEDQIVDAIGAGADGFVEKASGIDEVLRAVRTVALGATYFSRSIQQQWDVEGLVRQARAGARTTGIEALSAREREVLQLVGEANSNQRVAEELSISIKTVEAHLTRIKDKLNARNRGDLIRIAIRAGLVRDAAGHQSGSEAPD